MFTDSDVGIYTCNVGGAVQGNITLKLKPLDERLAPDNSKPAAQIGKGALLKNKTKGKLGMGKAKGKGKNAAVSSPAPGSLPGRLTDADGYVVDPPPSNGADNGNRFEAPVLLPTSRMEAGNSFAQELDRLRNGEQRDTVLPGSNGTFPRTSSLSLMEVWS